MKSLLFSPIRLRELTVKNRVFMAPMCQYSAVDGMPAEWHSVHYGGRATGGSGLIIVEATAVAPEGRITARDLGLWNDPQACAFRPMVAFLKSQGVVPAIQLAHAGRKASTYAPWEKGGSAQTVEHGGWIPRAPSAIPFTSHHPVPSELSRSELERVILLFEEAAHRSLTAGFEVVELHMAHGYLLHQFLSPLSNRRNDEYGGTLENRMRLPLAVADRVRRLWPEHLPVFVRVSATDWKDNGWDLEQTLTFCKALKDLGIDFIDCSSGGMVMDAAVPVGPGFQAPFAEAVRARTGLRTGAVGLITEPAQAEQILADGQADAILLGRQLLREPSWPLRAARELGASIDWPEQYQRAQ